MKNVLTVVLLCGAGAVILAAADSWQKKPYTQWDDDDIQKIMNDSPWAREVDMLISRNEELRSSSPMPGAGSTGGSGMGGRGGRGGGGESDSAGTPAMRFIVRFVSALPVRQAMMRARYRDEVGSSPAAAKVLSAPENYYVVAVGAVRRPPRDLQAVKDRSTLRVKGKEPFGPIQVRVEGPWIVLFFPREGHPIAVEDGEVEVQVRLPDLKNPIRRTFKLKNMVYQGKLEI